jgi:hypothetical protein
MKPHQTLPGKFTWSITLTVFVMVALLSLPIVARATINGTQISAELLMQAGDLDGSAPTAQPATAPAASETGDEFDTEKLEQLVAPIALYPDALLMQIMMAATYPLEIVEADRWIRDQPDLKGDALDSALLLSALAL